MKKAFSISLLAASLLFCSCGNADKVAKELMDSINRDSIARHRADSITKKRRADSAAAANQAAKGADSAKK